MASDYQQQNLSSCSNNSSGTYFRVIDEGNEKRVIPFRAWNPSFGDIISQSGTEDSPWICERCQYENFDTENDICSICGHKRNQNSIKKMMQERSMNFFRDEEPRRNDAMFNRQSFTLAALVEDKRLDSSSFTRSLAESSLSEDFGWSCPDCTFVNTNLMHLSCEVCGKEKPKNFERPIGKSDSNCSFSSDMLSQYSFVEKQLNEYTKYEKIARETENLSQAAKAHLAMLEVTQSEHSIDDSKELKGILAEGLDTVKALEQVYEDEKKEYDEMIKYQAERDAKIISEEGCSPSRIMNTKATKPGVQSMSPAVLEWHGQQRMLDDWKIKLDERLDEIRLLRDQQTQVTNRLLG